MATKDKAAKETAPAEDEAAVPGLQEMPPPLAGPVLTDDDRGYRHAGEWAGYPMYATTFDNFTTTDEAVMREYVAGYRQRTPGQQGLPEAEEKFRREHGS